MDWGLVFLLGILTSISPCLLATNIAAIAFISKDIKTSKQIILLGFCYTLGRGISYTLLAVLIYFGLSAFKISTIFQGWGEKILGPILILIGLAMLDVIKFNFKNNVLGLEKIKLYLANRGYLGAIILGMLFALAFCPYSGVLFFGVLIPSIMKLSGGLILAPIYAIGTGLPVIIFSILIMIGIKTVAKAYDIVEKVEKWIRIGIAVIFILMGIYYLQYLLKYILIKS